MDENIQSCKEETFLTAIQTKFIGFILFQVGVTPLHIACQNGDSACVEALIKRGADVNRPLKVIRYLSNNSVIPMNTGRGSACLFSRLQDSMPSAWGLTWTAFFRSTYPFVSFMYQSVPSANIPLPGKTPGGFF